MNINSNNIIPEFKKEMFEKVVTNQPFTAMLYQGYFPTEFRPTLTFASAEIHFGAKVMADIVGIGSKAPRKGREYAKTYSGEIPKIEIARDLTEADQIKMDEIRVAVSSYPNNVELGQQLIKKIYEDPQFCIDGVHSRLEWEAKQLASKGFFETTIENNAGGLVKIKIDFKVSKDTIGANIFAPNADFENFDPIAVIKKKRKESLAKGEPFMYMITDQQTFDQLMLFKKVQKFASNNLDVLANNLYTPTLEQMNQRLKSQNLPEFVIWESYFQAENKAGKREVMSGWEKGAILFTQTTNLGNTQYTLTPEFRTEFPDVITQATNSGFILVKSFGHQDPISISTKATAFAMPVLNNVSKIEILDCTK